MTVEIKPSVLTGTVTAITSKSAAHRALICAALSEGVTKLMVNNLSEDILATMQCLLGMGAGVWREGRYIYVKGITEKPENISLNCRESGSTLRFLLPVACLFSNSYITGEGRLPKRPLGELIEALSANGVDFSAGSLPFEVSGCLKSGKFILPGNISSGYVTGLMFALPLLLGDSEIVLTSKLESSAYVDMTIDMLGNFGIEIETLDNGYKIKGGQKYISPRSLEIEGDWSNAAFFLAAGAISGQIKLLGLDINSLQGDKAILGILKEYGAEVVVGKDGIIVRSKLKKGFKADVSGTPDLLPILSVLGADAEGETLLYNAARLRIKESDRLAAVNKMLHDLGARSYENDDSLEITGTGFLGGVTESFNDHRIAMSAAIAASGAKDGVIIKNAEAVGKSYPDFFEVFRMCGGNINVI